MNHRIGSAGVLRAVVLIIIENLYQAEKGGV